MRSKIVICAGILFAQLTMSNWSAADAKRSAAVPPGLEIEILDPGVDPLGNPAVLTEPGLDGEKKIAVPPAVIVHRYYYTGDRSFQGPMLAGGPSVVVVNHPRTGERLYLDVNLLPGAPRVCYTKHAIEYDYGRQCIRISFPKCGSPKVTYCGRRPPKTKLDEVESGAPPAERTGIGAVVCCAVDATKKAAGATVGATYAVGKAVLTPVGQVVEALPGVKMLSSTSEQRATVQRDRAVRAAQSRTERLEGSIGTLR